MTTEKLTKLLRYDGHRFEPDGHNNCLRCGEGPMARDHEAYRIWQDVDKAAARAPQWVQDIITAKRRGWRKGKDE